MMISLFFYLFIFVSVLQGLSDKECFVIDHNPLKAKKIATDPNSLSKICGQTADFLSKVHLSKFVKVDVGLLKAHGVTLDDVKRSLEFVVHVYQKNPKLLKNRRFLKRHFTFYHWYADEKGSRGKIFIPEGYKGPPESIRVTKYHITSLKGLYHKTARYAVPLYVMPYDEIDIPKIKVDKDQGSFLRFCYSYQEIIEGALEKNSLTKIFAWVTEAGYKDLVMQGTARIIFPDGKIKTLCAAATNGMKKKDRYWFFSEYDFEYVKRVRKGPLPIKVDPIANVSFAGNIKDLGFGKLIALEGKNQQTKKQEINLGVLVDTGSAFKNNFYQLDLFVGYFCDKDLFRKHCRHYPHVAKAYILIKKDNT